MALTTREKVAHLLRRFGLGASEAELDYYAKDDLKGAIDKLFAGDAKFDFQSKAFENGKGFINIRLMQGFWYLRMLATQNPLEEKMTLFWHNHFATSSEKVESAFAMERHIDTLRQNSLGKFRDLLGAISKDPAMIYWLDNQENVKGKPNENFAREVMELFTLGIGHYSEKDIQEAARAFSGWAYGLRGPGGNMILTTRQPRKGESFFFARARHDNGEKTVLGKTGNLNGDDVLDILCQQSRTSEFITKKFLEFFVYQNPSEETVAKFGKIFRDSDLNIAILARAVMTSDEFYSERALRAQVKTPIDFVVASARSLGLGSVAIETLKRGIEEPVENDQGLNQRAVLGLTTGLAARMSTSSMGMELMRPPDVSGWKLGNSWITSATMVERIKWADVLFGSNVAGPGQFGAFAGAQPQTKTPSLGVQAWSLFEKDPSPRGVVDAVCSLFDAPIPAAKRQQLADAAKATMGSGLTERNASEVAQQVCRLLFASPEYQFC